MERDRDRDGPTRRHLLVTGGATLAGGLVAGCSGDGSGDSGSPRTGTETEPTTPAGTTTSTASGGDSYTVSMAPMGEVTFESVPESIFTRLTHLAGMAFALGRGSDVNAMHAPDYYDALWNQFTPRLPGVSLDWQGLYSSWEPTREKLLDLDSDVHLADPASVYAVESWDVADVEEIASEVSPWFGNTYSDANRPVPEAWADRYEYYTLWEQFERVADVFRARDRYEALASVHEEVISTVDANLPADDRPTVAMAGLSNVDSPYVYTVERPGFMTAHVRPFEPVDAFGDDVASGDQVDMEAFLEADPDVIFALGGMHPGTDMAGIRTALRDHPVGSQLSAVRNDRVYAQGARYQGPILNLFQLEMTAKQLYPDAFGEWPTYDEGPYPEVPGEERLFDRERVAAAIRGDLDG